MKKDFEEYQKLMNQEFDWEDKIDTIGNEMWKLKNKKLQAHQQLRLVKDQIRLYFKRKRVEILKDE